MSSELARQLERHRQDAVPVFSKERGYFSLLYGDKAALYDLEDLRLTAINSLLILEETIDPELKSFECLFRPSKTDESFLSKKRRFLTKSQCSVLDTKVDHFLYRISPIWQNEDALNCLEYLIRQFLIHKYNATTLLAIALPYHDTESLFGTLVSLLDFPKQSLFLFLEKIAETKQPLKRSLLVQNCVRVPAILKFLADHVVAVHLELGRCDVRLTSFFTALCLEVFGDEKFDITDAVLRSILPTVFFAFQNPDLRELHVGAMCITAQLAQKVILAEDTVDTIFSDLFNGILRRATAVVRMRVALSEAFMLVNLMSFRRQQSSRRMRLPPKVLKKLCKLKLRPDLMAALQSCCQQLEEVDTSGLLECLFGSIVDEIASAQSGSGLVDVGLHAVNELEDWTEKNRIVVALTIIEKGLISGDDFCHAASPLLQALEQRFPSTVAFAINRFARQRDQQMLSRAVRVCLILHGECEAKSTHVPLFNLWNTLNDPSPAVRDAAITVAFDFLKKECETQSEPKEWGSPSRESKRSDAAFGKLSRRGQLAVEVLVKNSAERELDNALRLLQSDFLWSLAPSSLALANLLEQLFAIQSKAAKTLFRSLSDNSFSDASLCSLLVKSLSSDSLKVRMLNILQRLNRVVKQCTNKTRTQLGPILVPLLVPWFWGLNPSEDSELHSVIVELLAAITDSDTLGRPFAHTVNNLASAVVHCPFLFPEGGIESWLSEPPSSVHEMQVTVIQIGDNCPLVHHHGKGNFLSLLALVEASIEFMKESKKVADESTTDLLGRFVMWCCTGGTSLESKGITLAFLKLAKDYWLALFDLTTTTHYETKSIFSLSYLMSVEELKKAVENCQHAEALLSTVVIKKSNAFPFLPQDAPEKASIKAIQVLTTRSIPTESLRFCIFPCLVGALESNSPSLNKNCVIFAKNLKKNIKECQVVRNEIWDEVVWLDDLFGIKTVKELFTSFDASRLLKLLSRQSSYTSSLTTSRTLVENLDDQGNAALVTCMALLRSDSLSPLIKEVMSLQKFSVVGPLLCLPIWRKAFLSRKPCAPRVAECLIPCVISMEASHKESDQLFEEIIFPAIEKKFSEVISTAFLNLLSEVVRAPAFRSLEKFHSKTLRGIVKQIEFELAAQQLASDETEEGMNEKRWHLALESLAVEFTPKAWIDTLKDEKIPENVMLLLLSIIQIDRWSSNEIEDLLEELLNYKNETSNIVIEIAKHLFIKALSNRNCPSIEVIARCLQKLYKKYRKSIKKIDEEVNLQNTYMLFLSPLNLLVAKTSHSPSINTTLESFINHIQTPFLETQKSNFSYDSFLRHLKSNITSICSLPPDKVKLTLSQILPIVKLFINQSTKRLFQILSTQDNDEVPFNKTVLPISNQLNLFLSSFNFEALISAHLLHSVAQYWSESLSAARHVGKEGQGLLGLEAEKWIVWSMRETLEGIGGERAHSISIEAIRLCDKALQEGGEESGRASYVVVSSINEYVTHTADDEEQSSDELWKVQLWESLHSLCIHQKKSDAYLPTVKIASQLRNALLSSLDLIVGSCEFLRIGLTLSFDLSTFEALVKSVWSERLSPHLTRALCNTASGSQAPLLSKKQKNKVKNHQQSIESTLSKLCDFIEKNKNVKKAKRCRLALTIFLNGLMQLIGDLMPSVFETKWISLITLTLSNLSKDFQDDHDVSTSPQFEEICETLKAITNASIPCSIYLPSLNTLIQALVTLCKSQLKFLSALTPLLHCLYTMLASPVGGFLKDEYHKLIPALLNSPQGFFIAIGDSSSAFKVLETLAITPVAAGDTAEAGSACALWRQLFGLSNIHSEPSRLVRCAAEALRELAPDPSSKKKDYSAVRTALTLSLMGSFLSNMEEPEAFAPCHRDVAAILLQTVRTYCSTTKKSTPSPVQSGVMECLVFEQEPMLRGVCQHPASVLTSEQDVLERTPAVLEAAACLLFKTWLLKLDAAHLQPFMLALLNCARFGNATLLEEVTDEAAAGARIVALFASIVAAELGEVGVAVCISDLAEDLAASVKKATYGGFQQAANKVDDQNTSKAHSKKKKKRAALAAPALLSYEQSWWWLDVGVPSLLAIRGLARASDIQKSSKLVFVESLLPAAIEAVDLLAVLSDGNDVYTVWRLSCVATMNAIVSATVSETVQITAAINKILDRILAVKNPSVKIALLETLYQSWQSYSSPLMSTLTSSLPAIAQILEDSDAEVARQCRRLVRLIEQLTGESLQSRLGC